PDQRPPERRQVGILRRDACSDRKPAHCEVQWAELVSAQTTRCLSRERRSPSHKRRRYCPVSLSQSRYGEEEAVAAEEGEAAAKGRSHGSATGPWVDP